VEGVRACCLETMDCRVSDAQGYVSAWVPEQRWVVIALTDAQILRERFLTWPVANDLSWVVPVVSPADATDLLAEVGQTPDDTRGHLLVWALNDLGQPVGGVTLELDPPAGSGPHYFDGTQDVHLDPQATATGQDGFGCYFQLSPGEYHLSAEHAGASCQVLGQIVIPAQVVAGTISMVHLSCGQP
jgi:hypothetical protein